MSNNNFTTFTGELQKLNENYTINLKLDGVSQIIEQIQSIKDSLQSLSTPGLNEILSASSLITDISGLMLALYESHKKVDTSFDQMVKGLTSNTDKIQATFRKLGKYVGEGLVDGLKDSLKNVSKASESLGKEISYTFSSTLVISSPSKLMKKLASYIPEGVVEGIKSGFGKIQDTVSNMTDKIEDGSKRMSKMKFSLGGITAVAGIVASLVGYFVNMMSTNEELSTKMEEIWAKITAAFQPVIDVVMNLFDSFTTGGEGTCSMMDTIASVVAALAETLAAVISKVVGFFQENGDTIMAVVTTIWGFISGIIEGAVAVFGGIFDLIVGIFTGNGEKIKEGFAGIWEGIKGIFGGVGEFFGGIWDKELPLSSSSKPLALQASSKLISQTLGKSLCLPRIAKLFCSQAPCSI